MISSSPLRSRPASALPQVSPLSLVPPLRYSLPHLGADPLDVPPVVPAGGDVVGREQTRLHPVAQAAVGDSELLGCLTS